MKNKYKVQTGGKLYLAGEYAVLTPGCGAVIQFIPIYLSATIQEANTYQLVSDLFGRVVERPRPRSKAHSASHCWNARRKG